MHVRSQQLTIDMTNDYMKWYPLISLSIPMIILIFPPRGKIRQIVFDSFPHSSSTNIFVECSHSNLNDTNAGVLCTVREKVKQFQFAEIAIFLDMEPIGGTFKVLYEINGEIRRSPFPSTNKSNDKINGRIRQR